MNWKVSNVSAIEDCNPLLMIGILRGLTITNKKREKGKGEGARERERSVLTYRRSIIFL